MKSVLLGLLLIYVSFRRDIFYNSASAEGRQYSGSLPCYNAGEVYASAWIARTDLLVGNKQFENANLSMVSGELSSMFMISFEVQKHWREKERGRKKKVDRVKERFDIPLKSTSFLSDSGGFPIHTADVLDFSGIHLSSLERYANHVPSNNDRKPRRIREIKEIVTPAVQKLMEFALDKRKLGVSLAEDDNFLADIGSRTLVIIPYFAQVKWRMGESFLESRPLYLNATYFSLCSHFPHVVVAVQNQKDYDFVRSNSGLLLRDVIHLKINVAGFTKLPVAMIQDVSKRILNKTYLYTGFDFVFYTEADMLYTIRSMREAMTPLLSEPHLILFPHRLMTYLPGHLAEVRKRRDNIGKELDVRFSGNLPKSAGVHEMEMKGSSKMSSKFVPYSCCSDMFNCTTRKHWHNLVSKFVKVEQLYGLPVVIATSHDPFEGGKFRLCNVTSFKQCSGLYSTW